MIVLDEKKDQTNKNFVPFLYLPKSMETIYAGNEQRETKNKLNNNNNNVK